MSEESLDYEDLRRIIELVAAAPHVRDIRLKAAGIEIELHKQRSAPSPGAVQRQPHAGSEKAKRAPDVTCVIKSPLVGTFRRAEQQIAQPLVQVGDQVTAGTMVCMVDVLGELKPIRAGMSGVVLQMPVDDGAPVEFGQALAAIAPIA